MSLVTTDGDRQEVTKESALDIAEEHGLDLVQMATNGDVAVCKLMDYSKYLYDQSKKSKHHEKGMELKEIKMTWKISDHDLGVKIANAQRIIKKDNDKVKFIVVFKGREVRMMAEGRKLLAKVYELMQECSIRTSDIKNEGNNVTMVMEPKK